MPLPTTISVREAGRGSDRSASLRGCPPCPAVIFLRETEALVVHSGCSGGNPRFVEAVSGVLVWEGRREAREERDLAILSRVVEPS